MSDVFHLGLTKKMLDGASLAIVPGDPQRVKKIAELMDGATFLASHREYTSYLAYLDGKAVVVCSTGIGVTRHTARNARCQSRKSNLHVQ